MLARTYKPSIMSGPVKVRGAVYGGCLYTATNADFIYSRGISSLTAELGNVAMAMHALGLGCMG
jgi:hypothetical protein